MIINLKWQIKKALILKINAHKSNYTIRLIAFYQISYHEELFVFFDFS